MAYNYTETDILRYTPKSPGVYRIYNQIRGVYVGEAEDMEERLLRHRRGHSEKSGCIDGYSNPKQCEHEVVYGGKSARLAKEREWVRRYGSQC